MQNFTDIPSSRTLSDSLSEILNNDKTAISCNSGTTFPTTHLQIGMLCYRSDQLKLFQLISTNPDNWRFVLDLATGIDSQFAAKLNAAAYTAADVLAKLLTVDGAGTGLDADLLDGQHASSFASSTHNHNIAYLGISAKAADADKLDGFDATAFVRSVNGAGPDANGNATVNIDLSSRLAKTGDTMTGQLTMSGARIHINSGGGASWLEMYDDESPNNKKYLHANSNLIGFVGGDGSWKQYVNESGQMWAANYGWLHDRFAAASHSINVHQFSGNTGDGVGGGATANALVQIASDNTVRIYRNTNCNCNCNCDCSC
jgi:hypothetical protein